MTILGLNTLDILLIFVLFIGVLVGFVRGAFPQIISLASIWLGLITSLYLYKPLSNYIFQGQRLEWPRITSDTLAFAALLIVFFHLIRLVIKFLTTPPEEKKKKPRRKGQVGPIEEEIKSARDRFIIGPLSAIAGMTMGFILTGLWTALVLGVMQFTFQVDVTEVAGVNVPGQGLVGQMKGSTMVTYFNQVLWYLVQSVDIFVLDESADILKVVVCRVFPASC